MNDNRKYDYTNWQFGMWGEFEIIADWFKPGTKVIDLACGNGSLMNILQERKQVWPKLFSILAVFECE